ncbi:MAG: hypothetical protein QXW74_01005 [Archaeoglobaceae archaeon]
MPRRWIKKWPGFGPFSHLPPWERPGWYYGKCFCRYLIKRHFWNLSASPKEEISALEEYRKKLEAQKESIEEELKELERRIKELREKEG